MLACSEGCLIIMRVKHDKKIGRVIFIVEGDKDEAILLIALFSKALGYEVIRYDKRSKAAEHYPDTRDDKDSQVYIVPAKHPSVQSIQTEEKYFDGVFESLKEFGLNRYTARTYYLFDRDRKSNRPNQILPLIHLYGNSLDNGENTPGLFLLSYPSIEAYLADPATAYSSGKNIKEAICLSALKSLSKEEILRHGEDALLAIEKLIKRRWADSDLDNFAQMNEQIFNAEERLFSEQHTYQTLSLLSIALMDLGILEQ